MRKRKTGRYLPIAFIDLKAAFDKVSHEALLYKLHTLGVYKYSLLHTWISAFLSDRQMSVICGRIQSPWHTLSAGVTQGCVLSPLLFLIFINDIPNTPNTETVLYADDISIVPLTYNNTAQLDTQHALNNISSWVQSWAMSVSIDKSAVVEFRRDVRCTPPPLFNYILSQQSLSIQKEYTYLGVILDYTLSYKSHFAALKQRVTHTAYTITRIINTHGPPSHICITELVKHTLRAQLAYALPLWRPTETMLHILEQIMLKPIHSLHK